MSVGEQLRKLRETKNMTQKEFGEIVNKSSKAISRWELGITRPTKTQLQRIAEELDVPFDFFTRNTSEIKNSDDSINILLDRLIKDKIITDPKNIPEDIASIIMDAVKLELKIKTLNINKKEQ